MKTLVFATNNQHKVDEVRAMLPPLYAVQSLKELKYHEDIAETGATFHENAAIKAKTIAHFLGKPCFAEDSGLEVEVLAGAPGIFSARFAGEHGNHAANNELLLEKMQGQTNRKANFISVIAFFDGEQTHFFEGRVYGAIAEQCSGVGGFGYDPLFIPDGHELTFADLGSDVKNEFSHRAASLRTFMEFLAAR